MFSSLWDPKFVQFVPKSVVEMPWTAPKRGRPPENELTKQFRCEIPHLLCGPRGRSPLASRHSRTVSLRRFSLRFNWARKQWIFDCRRSLMTNNIIICAALPLALHSEFIQSGTPWSKQIEGIYYTHDSVCNRLCYGIAEIRLNTSKFILRTRCYWGSIAIHIWSWVLSKFHVGFGFGIHSA